MLWCWGAPYGAAGLARRNIPVFAGGGRRARGFRVLSPWPTSCPAGGQGGQEEIKEYRSVSRPPSRSLMLIAFGAAGNVRPATFSQLTCAEVAAVVPLWAPCKKGFLSSFFGTKHILMGSLCLYYTLQVHWCAALFCSTTSHQTKILQNQPNSRVFDGLGETSGGRNPPPIPILGQQNPKKRAISVKNPL